MLSINLVLLVVAVTMPRAFAQLNEQSHDSRLSSSSGQQLEDPARIFQEGQAALAKGDLKEAVQAFRTVLEIDPNSVGASANLGVVYMREKRWDSALTTLRKAEHLAPGVAGIRLNIGLAYYRQNMFRNANSGLSVSGKS